MNRKREYLVLSLFTLATVGPIHQGVADYYNLVQVNTPDSRVQAGEWIEKNIPASSEILLDGFIQHYLPRVLSNQPEDTLANSYFNILGAVNRIPFLRQAFDYYYANAKENDHVFDARAVVSNFSIGYDHSRMYLPIGAYIVISNYVYDRFYAEEESSIAPGLSENARDFYSYVRAQKHVASFSGRGPKIDIYQIESIFDVSLDENDAQDIDFLYDRAVSLQSRGKVEASLSYLGLISRLNPGYKNTYFLEGWAYQKMKNWPKAERAYLKELEIHPNHLQSRFNLAYGLMQQHRCIEAIPHFESYIDSNPETRAAHHWLAECYDQVGDSESAAYHEEIYRSQKK